MTTSGTPLVPTVTSEGTNEILVNATSHSPETLTYWTDARSTMARPNPNISNCGLVIVQVQPDNQRGQGYIQGLTEATDGRTFYTTDTEAQPLTTWSNVTLDNRIFLTETSMTPGSVTGSQPQQLIEAADQHHIVEEEDEGYRTSPGSDTSPSSSSTLTSSPPKIARKTGPQNQQFGQKLVTARNGGHRVTSLAPGGHAYNGEETNNLMWLLDFKLDFFNEGQEAAAMAAAAARNAMPLGELYLMRKQPHD